MDIDIKKIAKLCKIKVEDDIAQKTKNDLIKIINSIKDLPILNNNDDFLDSSDPMVLRKDVIKDKQFTREEILKNAPCLHAGCVVVPKEID